MHEFDELGAQAIRLLCGDQRVADVAAIRRSLSEAMLAWPGPINDRWWKWLVEAGRGLSYGTRVIDASPLEAFELLRHGVVVVTVAEEAGGDVGLVVLTDIKWRKLRVFHLPADSNGRWVSHRELSSHLGTTTTQTRRWVVLDPVADDVPSTAGTHPTGSHHESVHPSPWSRLREFMRPEWSDIWIVLIFALVVGMLTLATPMAVEALVNSVAFGTLMQPLIVLSVILLVFLGFAAALRFMQRFVVELIQRRLLTRVAARLAWQLPRVRLDRSQEFNPELLNRFFEIVTIQKIVAQLLLDGLKVVLTVGLGMIVLAFYHPALLAFDAVLLVLLAFQVFVLSRGAVRSSIEESRGKYAIAAWLEEIARCTTTFKTGGASDLALARANQLTTDYLAAREAHYLVLMRQIISGLALEALASAVLLGLGGYLVIQGQMTLGQLVAAELIVTYIVASISKLDKQFEAFYDLLTSMDKLGHLFDLPVETSSGVMHFGLGKAARVSLRGVSYHYDTSSQVLSNLTLSAAPGEVVAITGSPGCGKSTLLDLLFRLKEPTSGRILLDDLDLSDYRPEVLRQQVSLVRGMELIEGTVALNVHLDRPGISTADVREALRRVGLDGDERCRDVLPNWNLSMELSHDGRPLSESQARRIALARAIVSKPRLLLIDGVFDAFSDDDVQQLFEEYRSLHESCTILIATGRRAIIDRCDQHWTLLGNQIGQAS